MRRLFPFAFSLFPFAVSLVPFILLCALNSAGYRYGASDLAFYIPAALVKIDSALFPRDAALIASQARLTMIDETIAAIVRATGWSLPWLFAGLYCVALAILAAAAWLIGTRLYRTAWTNVALLAALTLRHAIAKSGTNTLEGYFHPRQLAFGLGALAVAAFLHGRLALAAAFVVVAGFLHPTTALWFAVWTLIAAAVAERRRRVPLAVAGALAAVAGAWLLAGPLAGRLVIMDPEWLATLATKDYLFPLAWPLKVWVINLAYAPVMILTYRRRLAAGLVTPAETGLVAGCVSLLLVFAAALPFTAMRVALAIQLQTPRVFWMLDFMTTLYAIWAIAEGMSFSIRRARMTAAVIVLASTTRGVYVALVRFPDRRVAQIDIADDDWGRVMRVARATPKDSGWLADPMHAVKYGTSLRVAGERDVFVEAVKDAAIGMYERDVAIRTRDRLEAIGDFEAMTPEQARLLASRYGLDYLVTDRPLDLPLAYQSGALHIYRLR